MSKVIIQSSIREAEKQIQNAAQQGRLECLITIHPCVAPEIVKHFAHKYDVYNMTTPFTSYLAIVLFGEKKPEQKEKEKE